MKELVVLSGKGGTGKTAVAASLTYLQKQVVAVDSDVDAPNLHLLLSSSLLERRPYMGMKKAQVSAADCDGCGACARACRFSAIRVKGRGASKKARVDPDRCEGCALCVHMCPREAIAMQEHQAGERLLSRLPNGFLVHGRLEPPAENSGKLVVLLKDQARSLAKEHQAPLVLVDGPPGIGCPVIATLSGADLCLLVTEPTPSGLHDLERTARLASVMHVPAMAVINRYDLNLAQSARIGDRLSELEVRLVGKLPYDETVPSSIARGLPPNQLFPASGFSLGMQAVWTELKACL